MLTKVLESPVVGRIGNPGFVKGILRIEHHHHAGLERNQIAAAIATRAELDAVHTFRIRAGEVVPFNVGVDGGQQPGIAEGLPLPALERGHFGNNTTRESGL